MTPELKIYLMTLMLPGLLDEIDAPMPPKTKSSFLRVNKFCEEQANEAHRDGRDGTSYPEMTGPREVRRRTGQDRRGRRHGGNVAE